MVILAPTIVSLSELQILSKGLNFVPSRRFDFFQTICDLNRFVRLLTVKRHFLSGDEGVTPDSITAGENTQIRNEFSSLPFADQVTLCDLQDLQREGTPFQFNTDDKIAFKSSNPSYYPLSSRANILDDFQYLIEQDLKALYERKVKGKKNLTYKQNEAITTLKENVNIVVRPADKGGSVVLLDRDLYFSLILSTLEDNLSYRKLVSDPTIAFSKALDTLLLEGVALGVLSQKESDSLKVKHPVTPVFHGLPKVHKNMFPPPLRPIIAGIGSLCEKLSQWVDIHLQPIVQSRPGFLRDSKQVLQYFENATWKESYSWMTLDVTSLYSCFSHSVALHALTIVLGKYSGYSDELRQFLIMSTEFLLSHNYFMFNNSYFLQLVGTPMGSKFSPGLANLVMSMWEEQYIYNADNPYRTLWNMLTKIRPI